jgi:cephalosporin-C deacetylase-like acetyl esterase
MRIRCSLLVPFVLLALALPVAAGAEGIALSIKTDRPEAVYEAGETVTFLIELTADGAPVGEAVLLCTLSTGEFWRGEKVQAKIVGGRGSVSATRDEPCVLWIEAAYGEEPDQVKHVAGAAFSPEQIEPSMPEPDDFDEFWTAQKERLAAIPMNARLEPRDSGDENVELFAITMDNINDTEIYGYFAKPKGNGPFPAMFQPQWAGVYSLGENWMVGWARQGFIALNINAHAIPNGKPAEYYKELSDGELRDYPRIGCHSRETCYFLRMYLSCARAVEYLTSRPEWDGEHLLVQGGSQGGGQALVTGGLCPEVTAVAANVPALCDHTGIAVGRRSGWPMLVRSKDGEPEPDVLEASRYFDAVNFARRIDVPTLIGTGFQDRVCTSSSIYAAYNVLAGPKRIVLDPLTGHGGEKPNWGDTFWKFRGSYGLGRGDWSL